MGRAYTWTLICFTSLSERSLNVVCAQLSLINYTPIPFSIPNLVPIPHFYEFVPGNGIVKASTGCYMYVMLLVKGEEHWTKFSVVKSENRMG
ncbi:hypothetical protein F4803DRAFT_354274 [Xylaria telfairii]|nr:hypothetical protein F4803DRAFT_354274 [Xylaria telfairii]